MWQCGRSILYEEYNGATEFLRHPYSTGARKIQGMFRCARALHLVRYQCTLTHDKIWSREHQRFYYFDNGNSKLLHGGIEVPNVGLVTVDSHGHRRTR